MEGVKVVLAARLQQLQDEKTAHGHLVLGIYCDASLLTMVVSPDGSASQSGNVTSVVNGNEACCGVVVLGDLHVARWDHDLDWRLLQTGHERRRHLWETSGEYPQLESPFHT